jgi:hypothetical protein
MPFMLSGGERPRKAEFNCGRQKRFRSEWFEIGVEGAGLTITEFLSRLSHPAGRVTLAA